MSAIIDFAVHHRDFHHMKDYKYVDHRRALAAGGEPFSYKRGPFIVLISKL